MRRTTKKSALLFIEKKRFNFTMITAGYRMVPASLHGSMKAALSSGVSFETNADGARSV